MEISEIKAKQLSVDEYIEHLYGSEYVELLSNFRGIQAEQYLLFARKNHDYGMKNVMAGTDLETEDDVKFALTGLWFRISDKINRWRNIMKNGWTTENENFLDTLQDITNYATIAQMVARGLWTNEKSTEDSQIDSGESESSGEGK